MIVGILRKVSAVGFVAGALALTAACSAISGLDDFELRSATSSDNSETTGGQAGVGGSGGAGETEGGGSALTFKFQLYGTGYSAHAGQPIRVQAKDLESGTIVDLVSTLIPSNGTFLVEGQILGGRAYKIGYFVDVNANATCDAAPLDRVWAVDAPLVYADVKLFVAYQEDFAPCLYPGFHRTFRLTGTGFSPHAGQMIRVEARAEGGTIQEIATAEVADDGTFTAEGMIEADKAYEILYFADMNANNSCDEAPTDHVWELAVDAAPDGTPADLTVMHNTDFGACLQ